jgi:kynureninase
MSQKDQFHPGPEFARQMDDQDALGNFRNRFYIPDDDVIYLDGNSLGRLPLETRRRIAGVVDKEWGTRLIRSWNEGWYELSQKISGKLAEIVGAKAGEIATGDSTSVNLYKTAMAALNHNAGKTRIVSDNLNFPTDIYVLQGIAAQLGGDYHLTLARSTDGISVSMEELDRVIDRNTAVVVLSVVAFRSAFRYDIKKITELVHKKGALIIWDLSHAAGAIPLDLNGTEADMAIGCTYKYLNGGPGSPAYLFVAEHLHQQMKPTIWGWFGEKNPFAFNLEYQPAEGIRRFLAGTPPVLSLAAIQPGLDLILEAGMENLWKKSNHQTEYLIYLWNTMLKSLGFELGSPEDPEQRGSHISLRHPEAYRICKALINPGHNTPIVIPDFREPDNIRIGIAPIYNTYREIFTAVRQMKTIVSEKRYESFSKSREAVT